MAYLRRVGRLEPLPDAERPCRQRLRASDLPRLHQRGRQVNERPGDVAMLRTEGLLADRERAVQ